MVNTCSRLLRASGLLALCIGLTSAAIADTKPPFEFRLFNQNGWSGQMRWTDTGSVEPLVVTSHKVYMPEGKDADALVLMLQSQTANPKHCVSEYVETGRSADGLSMTMTRAPKNSCASSAVTGARLIAAAPQRIAVELLAGQRVIATGDVETRRRGYVMQMPNARDNPSLAAREQARAYSRERSSRRVASLATTEENEQRSAEIIQGGFERSTGVDLEAAHKAFREQYEKDNPQAAGVPQSLNGLFLVTKDGLMLELFDNGRAFVGRIVQPNYFFDGAGLGTEINAIRGTYDSRAGKILAKRRLVTPKNVSSGVRHCGALYSFDEADLIKPVKPVKPGQWSLEPSNETFCTAPRVNMFSCQLTSCGKRESTAGRHEGTYLYTDRDVAMAVARKNKAADPNKDILAKQFAEMEAERRARAREQEPAKGYFERGGACGDLSCEEEDVNQFLVDQYW